MQPAELPSEALRDGAIILVRDGGTLPPRCIKCNGPASGNPIPHVFVDSNVDGAPHNIISAIRHFSSRRTGRVYISLCEHHHRLRTLIRWNRLLLAPALAIGIYVNVGIPKHREVLINIAIALTVASLLPFGIYQQHDLRGRVQGDRIWLSGAGLEFLRSLPTSDAYPQANGVNDRFAAIEQELRNRGIEAYHQGPNQLVLSRQPGPVLPNAGNSFWICRIGDDWYLCTWAPNYYRVTRESSLLDLCESFVDTGRSAQPQIPPELVARFALAEMDHDEFNRLWAVAPPTQ
jgi:hypothetical protein